MVRTKTKPTRLLPSSFRYDFARLKPPRLRALSVQLSCTLAIHFCRLFHAIHSLRQCSAYRVSSAAVTDVLALDTTDVFSADTTDVLSAAKAASAGSCPANLGFPAKVASGGKSSRKLAPPNFGHAGLAKLGQMLVKF